jgi:peptidoglycan/LPS O-acetylase OafA/YrhL
LKPLSGKYYIALDHVRAVACFTVFTWHFVNVRYAPEYNTPVPFFPLSFISEGHTGVGIFMTLSAYLFAKMLDGKRIDYKAFIWSRFIRLAPLLSIVILYIGLTEYLPNGNIVSYVETIISGLVQPVLPNGGWSVTTEFHFYLLLPFLLLLTKRSKYTLGFVLIATIALRIFLHQKYGEIQSLSYFTIVGRIDQFILGIMAYQFREYFTKKHRLVTCIGLIFAFLYWQFDMLGGFYHNPSYPSPSPLWIYMPTLEGIGYGSIIAWYDNSFQHSTGRFSRFIAAIGTYSYSIYLLQFFFFRMLSVTINSYIDLSNIHIALLASILAFLPMILIGYLSYRFIETPFFRFRIKYILAEKDSQ